MREQHKKACPDKGQAKMKTQKKQSEYSAKRFSWELTIRTLAEIISDLF